MDVRLGKKIGEGGCSEVYEWEGQSKIVKLAKANTDLDAMKKEYHNNRSVWEAGLPVPKPYELIELNGQAGLICERINAKSMMLRFQELVMNESPSDVGGEDIRIMARALYEIHSRSDISLPINQRDEIKYSIHIAPYLSLLEKELIIAHLAKLPAKRQLCHGDPNPGNFIIQDDGNAIVIDWMNASIGNPEADLADYMIMMRYAVLPDEIPSAIQDYFDRVREMMIDHFMEQYSQLSGVTYEEVLPWMIPAAVRKLSNDGIGTREKERLVHFIRSHIHTA